MLKVRGLNEDEFAKLQQDLNSMSVKVILKFRREMEFYGAIDIIPSNKYFTIKDYEKVRRYLVRNKFIDDGRCLLDEATNYYFKFRKGFKILLKMT